MKNALIRKFCLHLALFLLLAIQGGTAAGLAERINVNTASVQQLKELPYIGEKRARAIVNYRHKHGPFHSLEQLVEVADIGEKSLEAIKPYLALETTPLQPNKPGATSLHPKITTLPGDIVVLQDAEYFSTLVSHVKSAKYSICMTMFLFKTTSSPGNKAGLLVKELINARKKGVDVLVILENSGYDQSLNKENRNVGQELRNNNIRIFYDSPKATTHAKIVVIDGRYSFIGSHNLTHSALAFNHEVSLLIDNTDLAAQLTDYMAKLY